MNMQKQYVEGGAYEARHRRRRLSSPGIRHRLARKGTESTPRLRRQLTDWTTAYNWSPTEAGSGGCIPPPSFMSWSQVRRS